MYIAAFIICSECITSILLVIFDFPNNSDSFFAVGSIISKLIFALLIQIVAMIFLVYYLRKDINVEPIEILVYIILLIINYISVIQFDSIQRMILLDTQNKVLEQQGRYYINQCKITNELWETTRRFRHDIKNQYIVEKELLKRKKYEGIMDIESSNNEFSVVIHIFKNYI